ncbi:MAG: hypothetical protein E6G58_04290 [Actinobacteria bacterium]|nr:MAG: hypothetical protein E6G58_04290 [Actinomycetota bacterium]
MIIGTDDRRGIKWPLFAVLVVMCGLFVAGASFMQRSALTSKVKSQESKASAIVRQIVAPALGGANLTKPLPSGTAVKLRNQLQKGPLAGGVIVRVRIFSQDGTLLFSSDAGDDPGTKPGDADAIRSAAGGAATGVVGIDRVSIGTRPTSIELLHTYVRLQGARGKPSGAVSVDQRYAPIEAASQKPWHTAELGLGAAAVVFLLITLLLLSRRLSIKRARARAHSRPASPPGTSTRLTADEGSPKADPKRWRFRRDKEATADGRPSKEEVERAEKEAQREIQVREALETQLEQLRTRIREQEDQAGRHVLELTQQLQVAAARAEEAEARAAAPGGGEAAQRLAAAERFAQETGQRARGFEAKATAAEARVTELEARLVEASQASMRPVTDERITQLERAAQEAMAAAADSARRAEATEAVRDELETKVAQLGSRAAELEATTAAATQQLREVEAAKADLERRAQEAESGGDAVRGEMAQLTAERDALRARLLELEQSPPTKPDAPDTRTEELERHLDSTRAELEQMDQRLRRAYAEVAQARSLQRAPDPAASRGEDPRTHELRQELARALERAQAAEERAARLEADLLAERHGVREIDEGGDLEPDMDPEPKPIPAFRTMVPSEADGNGTSDKNGDGEQGDKSLRFRLAQSAARKKGLGDLESPSS